MTMPGSLPMPAELTGQPTVVIADDQALVRTGFRMILAEAGIPVVAEAADGTEAVNAVLKHVTPEYLVSAVRLVRSGDALLSPSITRRLVERFAPADLVNVPVHAELAALTPRELEVQATITTHVGRILTKLQLRDRVQAVVLAYQSGLVGHEGTGQ